MALTWTTIALAILLACTAIGGESARPDIRSAAPDLQTPPMTGGEPGAGKRVKQSLPEYRGTEVYHVLYLPEDWQPGKRYPVLVEYAGNGPYHDKLGDVCTGRPEDSNLGYGISGGKGFIWVCMPYVNAAAKKNQTQWWGDVDATVAYCRACVRTVCENHGGDPSAVVLAGFSRGAIACGYIGLHDDAIADLWLAFIPYSHYDGVTNWGYAGADAASAVERLKRIKGRASFVCHENSVDATRKFVESSGVVAPFTFRVAPFRNHNDGWVLRDTPERTALREWLKDVLEKRPGRAKRE
jgi:hypothetical protein